MNLDISTSISQHEYHIYHHTQKGETALMRATKNDHAANVVELIKAGADLNLQNKV